MQTATAKKSAAHQMARALIPQVNACLVTRAHAETWRAKMDAWDRDELARFEYMTAAEFVERGREERIMEPKHTFLMCDEDSAEFHKQRQYFVDSLGLDLKPGWCPALVAEEHQRQAEHLLIESARAYPGFEDISAHRLLCGADGLEKHRKYIDLLIGLVVNYPGYAAPKLREF